MRLKARTYIQLLNLPLWVLILFYLIARREKTEHTQDELATRKLIVRDLYYSLPLPHNWLERQLVTILIEWINNEENQLIKMLRPFGALGLLNE